MKQQRKVMIDKRVLKHARMFLERGETIRSVANKSSYSKSTIHLDLVKRLPELHHELYLEVRKKLNLNYDTKGYKGGESTKLKWEKIKNEKYKKGRY